MGWGGLHGDASVLLLPAIAIVVHLFYGLGAEMMWCEHCAVFFSCPLDTET